MFLDISLTENDLENLWNKYVTHEHWNLQVKGLWIKLISALAMVT
jgi:hypothetical protein